MNRKLCKMIYGKTCHRLYNIILLRIWNFDTWPSTNKKSQICFINKYFKHIFTICGWKNWAYPVSPLKKSLESFTHMHFPFVSFTLYSFIVINISQSSYLSISSKSPKLKVALETLNTNVLTTYQVESYILCITNSLCVI